ncbi:hypothetical protein ACN47E_002148 [Coniothyrium glycines]
MVFRVASRLTLFLCFYIFIDVTQATFDDDVEYANVILHGIAASLASPFCSDRNHYQQSTETCTVTGPAYTITSTIAPQPCSTTAAGYEQSSTTKSGYGASSTPAEPSKANSNPVTTSTPSSPSTSETLDLSTITSTTTITYITTSTIWVPPPTQPTKRALSARQDNLPLDRETWCSDYSVPCRLVQYTPDVISAACRRFLGPEVVTVTSYVTGPRVVRLESPGCGERDSVNGNGLYYDDVPAPPPPPKQQQHDDESVPEYYTYEDGNPLIPDVEVPDEYPAWLNDFDDDTGPASPVFGFEDGNPLIADVEVPDEMPAWLAGGNDVKVDGRPW